MSEPIYRIKLFEDVANHIQERIRSEQWQAGHRIPSEADLALEFDVSRSTVREAVRSLQLAGILYSKAGSGSYVAEDAVTILMTQELVTIMRNPDHLCDLVRARYVLEPQLAALAAVKADKAEKEKLLQMAKEMNAAADRKQLMKLGHAFHMELAAMSHNAVLDKIYRSLASQMRSMRVLESLTLEVYLEGAKDHCRVAVAVAAGNADAAHEAMRHHLEKDYGTYLDQT